MIDVIQLDVVLHFQVHLNIGNVFKDCNNRVNFSQNTQYIYMHPVTKPFYLLYFIHAWIQRGDRGSGPHPLKNHKNIGFLSNTGSDPLKMTKLPSQYSMSGHHQHARETPFKWRFTCRPMMARLWCYLDPLIKQKKRCKV